MGLARLMLCHTSHPPPISANPAATNRKSDKTIFPGVQWNPASGGGAPAPGDAGAASLSYPCVGRTQRDACGSSKPVRKYDAKPGPVAPNN